MQYNVLEFNTIPNSILRIVSLKQNSYYADMAITSKILPQFLDLPVKCQIVLTCHLLGSFEHLGKLKSNVLCNSFSL